MHQLIASFCWGPLMMMQLIGCCWMSHSCKHESKHLQAYISSCHIFSFCMKVHLSSMPNPSQSQPASWLTQRLCEGIGSSAWRFTQVLCQSLPKASQSENFRLVRFGKGWVLRDTSRNQHKYLMQAWEASACQRHSCWMHECGWDSSTFMRRPLDGTWRHERCQWKSSCWTLRLRSYLW